jgi:hypothetical protein
MSCRSTNNQSIGFRKPVQPLHEGSQAADSVLHWGQSTQLWRNRHSLYRNVNTHWMALFSSIWRLMNRNHQNLTLSSVWSHWDSPHPKFLKLFLSISLSLTATNEGMGLSNIEPICPFIHDQLVCPSHTCTARGSLSLSLWAWVLALVF